MATPYYDGNWTSPRQSGPVVTLSDPETKAKMFRYKFKVLAANYKNLDNVQLGQFAGGKTFASQDTNQAYLVDFTTPRDMDFGVVEFERTYSLIPPSRTEYELVSATYQYVVDDALGAITTTEQARVTYSYEYLTPTQRAGVTLDRAFKLFFIGSALNFLGTEPDVMDTEMLAEDETLTRWRGWIYERRNVWIPVRPETEYS